MLLEGHLSQGIVRGRGGLRGSLRTCEDQRQWGAAHSLCGQLGQVRSQQLQDVRWQGWFQRSLVAVVCPNCQVIGEESLQVVVSWGLGGSLNSWGRLWLLCLSCPSGPGSSPICLEVLCALGHCCWQSPCRNLQGPEYSSRSMSWSSQRRWPSLG